MFRNMTILLITALTSLALFASDDQVVIIGRSLRDTDRQEYVMAVTNLVEAAYRNNKRVFIAAPEEFKKEFINWQMYISSRQEITNK